jgi:hypothetical protein
VCADWLKSLIYQPRKEVEELLLQGSAQSWRFSITRDYCECRKECTQESFLSLEPIVEVNIRKDRYFEVLKRRTRSEITS